jgi:alpha-L-rhamnosidase
LTDLRVARLRCEHLVDPCGVERRLPRLSWHVESSRPATRQAAYHLLVASSSDLLAAHVGDLWDSGRVPSDECVLVPYAGAALASRVQAFWTVRVWDEAGTVSPYGPMARWEMGLLDPTDWQAEWVSAPGPVEEGAVSYLRSELVVPGPVRKARAYVTALGLYELHCNGSRVGDARFTPGWTDYEQRVQYQVLDLTDLLVEGRNALGALLAEGWYAGYVGFQGTRNHYGTTPSFLAQVEVQTDAGLLVHVTDGRWRAGTGQVVRSDMLRGEEVDARRDRPWCVGEEPPGEWRPVRLTPGTPARRVVSPAPAVRGTGTAVPVRVERVGPDTHRIDFGQNLVGWVRLRLDGPRDTEVVVRHSEVLRPDGGLYVENLRTASATDTYLLAGDGPRTFEPRFTFHGFRYAEVTGYPAELVPADVSAVVCGTDLERVGHFSCSDDEVNQLHSNIVWGARGNFLDIPTDCPQRDERMGWTGDAQVFAPTACYLFDMAGFFTKWLRDMVDGQSPEGSFPDVAPRVLLAPEGSAGWADAGVLVPWAAWSAYADRELLAELFPAMRRWVDYVHRANPGLLWEHARGYDNGDWLAVGADTDKDLIATAYFARSARVTAQVADELGLTEAARELHGLADGIVDAFRAAYGLTDGRLTSPTQTAYALALRFDLLPASLRAAAAEHLVADVEEHGGHLTTGFLGVGQLLPALVDAGRADVAYRLLLQRDFPSWLHSVRAGATTVWERWDGWTKDRGYGDPAMNSYNHYALGSVGEWLYRSVAGIDLVAPGGRRIRIAPVVTGSLEWAAGSLLTPYGWVRTRWEHQPDGVVVLDVEVPVGITADVRLPDGRCVTAQSGHHRMTAHRPRPARGRVVVS